MILSIIYYQIAWSNQLGLPAKNCDVVHVRSRIFSKIFIYSKTPSTIPLRRIVYYDLTTVIIAYYNQTLLDRTFFLAQKPVFNIKHLLKGSFDLSACTYGENYYFILWTQTSKSYSVIYRAIH